MEDIIIMINSFEILRKNILHSAKNIFWLAHIYVCGECSSPFSKITGNGNNSNSKRTST